MVTFGFLVIKQMWVSHVSYWLEVMNFIFYFLIIYKLMTPRAKEGNPEGKIAASPRKRSKPRYCHKFMVCTL